MLQFREETDQKVTVWSGQAKYVSPPFRQLKISQMTWHFLAPSKWSWFLWLAIPVWQQLSVTGATEQKTATRTIQKISWKNICEKMKKFFLILFLTFFQFASPRPQNDEDTKFCVDFGGKGYRWYHIALLGFWTYFFIFLLLFYVQPSDFLQSLLRSDMSWVH